MSLSTAELNGAWAEMLVEELVRCGVDRFCFSSGSRSTPLTVAAVRHPRVHAIQHVDERGIGYAAVGYARAMGRPAAVVTTSGTAVANLLPAVCEASEDRVPMLLLSADRPPELRDTRANQTLRQPGIFGHAVRWECDLPCPTGDIDPAFVLTTVDHAVSAAQGIPPGPVHLNLMFRKPFEGRPGDPVPALGPRAWRDGTMPYTARGGEPLTVTGVPSFTGLIRDVRRGLLVIGGLGSPSEAVAAAELAGRLGWPVCADLQSGLRFGGGIRPDLHCPYYEALLLDSSLTRDLDGVVHLGGRLVSTRLASAIAQRGAGPWIQLSPDPGRHDPHHRVSHQLDCSIQGLLGETLDVWPDPDWLPRWQDGLGRVEALYNEILDPEDDLTEPGVARRLSAALPPYHGFCVGNSMPVRQVTAFAAAGEAPRRVCVNRGVSGIDGTVATAAGFAAGLGAPVTVLLGDLSLLHDLNGLSLVARSEHPVILVVINNDGGGIFHFLPIAEHTDIFEPWFGTPHGRTFEEAAAMFGLDYARPETMAELEAAYRSACDSAVSALIEVRTDRTDTRSRHREIERRLRELWPAS